MANAFRPRLVTFETRAVLKRSRIAVSKGLADTAVEMTKAIKKTIGKQGPPRSRPGNAPKKDTGFLHANLEVKKAGTNLALRVPQYGIWLETGTRLMAARPYIAKTI